MIEVNWKPEKSTLRLFALIWLIGFSSIAVLIAWRGGTFEGGGSWIIPQVLWAIAAVVGAAGLILPVLVRPVYFLWMGVTYPVGWVLSHLILLTIYYGLFTPLGIIFRIIGRDPLNRKQAERSSYWIEKNDRPSVSRYFRQY